MCRFMSRHSKLKEQEFTPLILLSYTYLYLYSISRVSVDSLVQLPHHHDHVSNERTGKEGAEGTYTSTGLVLANFYSHFQSDAPDSLSLIPSEQIMKRKREAN